MIKISIILLLLIGCQEPENIHGCTDSTACNYDINSNADDGSCEYAAEYYDCAGNCLIDTDGDSVCDELEIFGCTDSTACNYDVDATDLDDCTYSEENYDCEGNCIVDIDECNECGGDGSTCNENSNDMNSPYSFEVISVYPNPFNPSVTISYVLSSISYTSIKVFDMDGREIEMLLNKIQSPGYYHLDWEPKASLSSGNYFIHIQSSNNLVVRKVTYIK